ncbi:MAG: cohesin domain-containing protein [Bacteroidetes bacterium]|nr:cohesin domain-containing protein [Bacteroidota bacterium]
MKRSYFWIYLLLLLFPFLLRAQNAPVTKVGSITHAVAGTVAVPVTVTNFINIGSISLTLQFNSSALTYLSITPDPVLASTISVTATPGNLVISWYGPGITMPDQTHLFDINFTYVSGSSLLTWYDNGGSCQYTNGSSVILNDSPASTYYINGIITNQAAPVTIAPTVTNAVSGSSVPVNITVNDFTNIGSISLTLEYKPSVLSFQTVTANPLLSSWVLNTSTTLVNGRMRLTISCIPPLGGGGTPATLTNGSILFTINYMYTASLTGGNYSLLKWIDDGGSCQYTNGSSVILYDSPTADYYQNGLVTRQLSPKTYLPSTTNATAGGDVEIPVTVQNYSSITSLALEFEYDPAVLSYTSFTQNAVFGGNLGVTDMASTSGKKKIRMGYFGGATTIGNGLPIATIKFHYISGTTALTWRDENSTACDYGDISGYSLYNTPTSDYYFDGVVASRAAPVITAESTTGFNGTEIILPAKVTGFTNIGSVSLTLDYDPGVITYVSTSPNCAVSSNFVATVASAGRITLSWYGGGVTLPDNSTLCELHFTYHGGYSPLNWYDNGGSCQYSDGSSHVLYDQPQSTYYINGQAGSGIWTGSASTDWDAPANWQSNVIPTGTITAIIPAAPTGSRWPTRTGDLTLGGNCKNLILEGISELTVTGTMTINAGLQLNVTGSANLKIGKDWSNSGVFNAGTGSVEFTGADPSTILAGATSINNIRNFQPTTFTSGMTYLSGGTAGPTGDNAHLDVTIGFPFKYLGTSYSDLRINTNGWVSLDKSGDDATSANNTALYNATAPNMTLAPWWDDLKADGSTVISYKTEGATPNRVFTVEWKNILSYTTVSDARLNFQVKLYEFNYKIEFCYGSVVSGTHSPNEGASAGMDDASGGFMSGSNMCNAKLVSPGNWPTTNYRFIPPPQKETFYKIIGTKTNSTINIDKDVIILKK